MNKTINFWAVVPAAGVGKRMQTNRPKQYLDLSGKTVIERTLKRLLQVEIFSAIAVAISEGDPYWPELTIANHEKIILAPGGKKRADSVLSGLISLQNKAQDDDWVLVHDAARPCVSVDDINTLINTLRDDPVGGILALASHDTLKSVDGNRINNTINRSTIWRALTPQMFRYGELKAAILQAAEAGSIVTDEASALELQGKQPKIVEGHPDNIKITQSEDLALATFFLEQQ